MYVYVHSKGIQFFIFNFKGSRLSDCFNSTGLNPIYLGLKTITIKYRDIASALDVFQKYRFCEVYTNLF